MRQRETNSKLVKKWLMKKVGQDVQKMKNARVDCVR